MHSDGETPSAATDSDDQRETITIVIADSISTPTASAEGESPSATTDLVHEKASRATEFNQHALFEAGNTAAVKHGARSPRIVNPIAAEIAAELLEAHLHLADPANAEAVRQYARFTAQLRLLDADLDEKGAVTEGGRVRPAAHLLAKVESTRLRWLAELGLTPSSAARLARDNAAKSKDVVDIAQVLARMNRQAAQEDSA